MSEKLSRYCVCLNTARDDLYVDDWWLEFYWAEDSDHAEEQAENAHPHAAVVCTRPVPAGDNFYLALVEGYDEPVPMRGPFASYDAAVEAHYQAALDEWPEQDAEALREIDAHQFYLDDDAVRIARG